MYCGILFGTGRQPSRRIVSGFTLVELLVALIVTSLVTAVAFAGLVRFLRASERDDRRIVQQMMLETTLDFLKDEVRLASSLAERPTCPTEDCEPVLEIHNDRLDRPIWIYLETVVNDEGGLTGTQGIYRFGPRFDLDGTYEAEWSTDLLLDGLPLGAELPEESCSGEDAVPSGTTEFFACTQAKLTTLSLRLPDGRSVEVTVFPRL